MATPTMPSAKLVLYAQWSPYIFAGGDGIIGDPYIVKTVEQLNQVRNFSDTHFRQTVNIDLDVPPWDYA